MNQTLSSSSSPAHFALPRPSSQPMAMFQAGTAAGQPGDHEFLLLSANDATDPSKYTSISQLAQSSEEDGLSVIDPWFEIECRADKYAAELLKVLVRWKANPGKPTIGSRGSQSAAKCFPLTYWAELCASKLELQRCR
jgi:hypothetical protein